MFVGLADLLVDAAQIADEIAGQFVAGLGDGSFGLEFSNSRTAIGRGDALRDSTPG